MDVRIEEVPPAMLEATELPDGTARVAPDRPFADVVHEHLDRLYGYCVHLCGDRTDAEDLPQDPLVRAMRSFDGLRDPKAARTWLFTIATNCARDRWRARGRVLDTVPLEAGDPDDDFSLFTTIAIEDPFPYSDELPLDFLRLFGDEDLHTVFAAMTPVFRAPILLTTIHGFSCKEAAAVLGVPLGTLLSRLPRGRKQLQRGPGGEAARPRLGAVG